MAVDCTVEKPLLNVLPDQRHYLVVAKELGEKREDTEEKDNSWQNHRDPCFATSQRRGDGNAHLLCPQSLQNQDHSPICSMGRCQPPTPKEGSSCCSSLLTRASLQFFLEIDFIRFISRCLPTLNRDLIFRFGLGNT